MASGVNLGVDGAQVSPEWKHRQAGGATTRPPLHLLPLRTSHYSGSGHDRYRPLKGLVAPE